MSGDPFPEKINGYLATWKERLTEYEFRLWDQDRIVAELGYSNLYEFQESTDENVWIRQTIQTRIYAFAADFIRVFALNKYGGIYLDIDVEITGTFEDFLENSLFIGFDYNNDLEPAILGSVSDHPWIKLVLDYYKNKAFIKKNGFNNHPLPTIFDKTSKALFRYKQNGEFQKIDFGIAIFPYEYFSPKNIYLKRIEKSSKTVAIHHFEGSWVERNFNYYFKGKLHQSLYIIGGKSFHDRIINLWRILIC